MKIAVAIAWGEAAIAPIVYSGDPERGVERAAALGFDGVELNGDPNEINVPGLRAMLRRHDLELSALMTGAPVIRQGLSFCSADPAIRKRAAIVMQKAIDIAAEFGSLVSVGLIVGRPDPRRIEEDRGRVLDHVAELADYAAPRGVRLAVEPVNRYVGTFANRVEEILTMLDGLKRGNLGVMLDTFHMNIEEPSIEEAIRRAGHRTFYVQLADSNRWAPGFGHLDFRAIIDALRECSYSGWLSAEVLPLPDADTAARKAIDTLRGLLEGVGSTE